MNLNLRDLALLSLLAVAGCAQPLVTQTTETVPSLTVPPRPREVQAQPLTVQVVTQENFPKIQAQLRVDPKTVLLVLTPTDYETLVNNIAELRRYLQQQTSLIEYYEATIQALQKPHKAP